MVKLSARSLITEVTAGSLPSISEIVQLFSGLQVRRNITNFFRVFKTKYIDTPLEPGYFPSRFGYTTHPKRREYQFWTRVTYGAQTIDTAIYESIVRDAFDLNPNRVLTPMDYLDRSVISFSSEAFQFLTLLELTGGKATCYGVPTDVIWSSDHTEGQHFSRFVFESMPEIDGFIYPSRYTEEECVALYHDRVMTRLRSTAPMQLNSDIVKYAML